MATRRNTRSNNWANNRDIAEELPATPAPVICHESREDSEERDLTSNYLSTFDDYGNFGCPPTPGNPMGDVGLDDGGYNHHQHYGLYTDRNVVENTRYQLPTMPPAFSNKGPNLSDDSDSEDMDTSPPVVTSTGKPVVVEESSSPSSSLRSERPKRALSSSPEPVRSSKRVKSAATRESRSRYRTHFETSSDESSSSSDVDRPLTPCPKPSEPAVRRRVYSKDDLPPTPRVTFSDPSHYDRNEIAGNYLAAVESFSEFNDLPPPTPRIPGRESPTPQPSTSKAEKVSSKAVAVYSGMTMPRTPKVNSAAEAEVALRELLPGVIKSLTMNHIMSHLSCALTNLDSKPINFITGENGAGKSAILAGIVAGLGGKAFEIGRGSSIKDLISHGHNQGRIEIVLHNPYIKSHGDEITIIRTITREGSSRYQTKDLNGSLRKLDRTELNMILARLNIQVNNPLVILNQDKSRELLNTHDPGELYKKFYSGALLDACEKFLQQSQQNLKLAESNIKERRIDLEKLICEKKDWDEKSNFVDRLEDMQSRLRYADNCYAWALVKEAEGKQNIQKRKFDDISACTTKLNEQWNSTSVKLDELEETKKFLDQHCAEHISNRQKKKTEQDQVKGQRNILQRSLNEFQSQLNDANKIIQDCQRVHATITKRKAEHLTNFEQRFAMQKKLQEDKEKEIEAKIAQIEYQLEVLRNEEPYLKSEYEVAAKAFEDIDVDIKAKQGNIRKLDTQIQDMKTWENSLYDAYGSEMYYLMKRIGQTKFNKPPRGPLGSCFTITKPEWADLVESILYHALWSFCVDNSEDQKKLCDLIEEVYGSKGNRFKKPQICLTQFAKKRYDVRQHMGNKHIKTKGDFPTVLDVIDVNNNDYVVYNWLIDTQYVERQLLFKCYEDGCDIMKNRKDIPDVLRGFAKDGYTISPDPHFKAMYVREPRKAKILKYYQQEDTVNAREDLERDKRRLQLEVGQRQDGHKSHKSMADEAKRIYEHHVGEVRKKTEELHKEMAIKNTVAHTFIGESADTSSWEEELRTMENNIDDQNQRILDVENEIKENQYNLQGLDYQLQALAEEIEAGDKKVQQYQLKNEQLTTERTTFQTKMAKEEQLVRNSLNNQSAEERNLLQLEASLEKLKADALLKCNPPKITKTSKEYLLQMNNLEADLNSNDGIIKNKEHVKKKCEELRESTQKLNQEIEVVHTLVQLVQPLIRKQGNDFTTKIEEYGNLLSGTFRDLINERHYTGNFDICHKTKQLQCYVCLDQISNELAAGNMVTTDGSKTGASKKGLREFACNMSGGERSFSTICLLAACWDIMDMPFYILDEFDVFMDPLNRQVSQKILVEAARKKSQAQYFILTPLHTDSLPTEHSHLFKNIQISKKSLTTIVEDGEGDGQNERRLVKM